MCLMHFLDLSVNHCGYLQADLPTATISCRHRLFYMSVLTATMEHFGLAHKLITIICDYPPFCEARHQEMYPGHTELALCGLMQKLGVMKQIWRTGGQEAE